MSSYGINGIDADEVIEAMQLATFVRQHWHVIDNALGNHAERIEEAAKDAGAAYLAGQEDPKVKAQQDSSIMTNMGLFHAAEMFKQEVTKTKAVIDGLRLIIEGPDEEVTWHAEDEKV